MATQVFPFHAGLTARSALFALLVTAVALVSTAASALAQEGSIGAVTYDVAIPVGSFSSNHINDVSFRGIHFSGRWFLLKKQLSFGAEFGWNTFHDELDRGTYDIPNGAVTATLYRYTEVFSLWPTVHYYPLTEGLVRPFVGTGMGISSVRHETLASNLIVSEQNWAFALKPEVGTLIFFGEQAFTGAIVSAHYTLNTTGFNDFDITAYLGFEVGLFVHY